MKPISSSKLEELHEAYKAAKVEAADAAANFARLNNAAVIAHAALGHAETKCRLAQDALIDYIQLHRYESNKTRTTNCSL